MHRRLHPLVTLLVGAGFGIALCGLLALPSFRNAQPPSPGRVALFCLGSAGLFALVAGMAHACHWAYYNFAAIRAGARCGFILGVMAGLCLGITGCVVSLAKGELVPYDDGIPYLLGALGGVVGFLVGIIISVVTRK